MYEMQIALDVSANFQYTICLYPADEFYQKYVTNLPAKACAVAVVFTTCSACIALLYGFLMKRQLRIMKGSLLFSDSETLKRDAILLAKKKYVRYISHEMRTPLNAAYVGLKVLEKVLIKGEGQQFLDRVATVKDVMDACDIAISCLNDLLNYDKLEDGTLMVEPKSTVALPFLLSSIKLFNLQAEDKGVNLIFDLHKDDLNHILTRENTMSSPVSATGSSSSLPKDLSRRTNFINAEMSYVGENDYITVDENKMSQVIRNLVSNAIKFTPSGRSVTVKIRKENIILPSTVVSTIYAQSNSESKNSGVNVNASTSTGPGQSFHDISSDSIHCNSTKKLSPHKHEYDHDHDIETSCNCCFYTPKKSWNQPKVFPNISNQVSEYTGRSQNVLYPISYGTLVIDIIDAGVGMALEDSDRLFKEVIQFHTWSSLGLN